MGEKQELFLSLKIVLSLEANLEVNSTENCLIVTHNKIML